MPVPENTTFGYLAAKKTVKQATQSLPPLQADELLVKQEACNICTTDYQQWQGLREHQGYPMAGGHECSGTVIAKGAAVGSTYQVGDKVSVIYDYCGYCNACKQGEVTNCEDRKQFGKNYSKHYFGIFGFATYFIRKAKSFVKMNPDLPAAEAAFVEPLSSVIANLKKLRLNPGQDKIVVIGGGTMGLLNALTAQAMGAQVIVSEHRANKVALAKKLGFTTIHAKVADPVQRVQQLTAGKGADIVIVAVGRTEANQQALKMVKQKDGKIALFSAGYPAPNLTLDSNTIHYRRLELIGTYGSTLEDFMAAAELLNTGKVNVSKLIEAQLPLAQLQQAFELASKGNYRVSVNLNEED
jgi:L-iditol 2-dehydrogenase